MATKTRLQSAGDGTAVPAGYKGENSKSVPSGNTAIATFTTTDLAGASVSLTAGVWLLVAHVGGYASSTGGNASIDFLIRDGSNNNIVRGQGTWTAGALNTISAAVVQAVTITSTTSYKLSIVTTSQGAATISATVLANSTGIQAVRIA